MNILSRRDFLSRSGAALLAVHAFPSSDTLRADDADSDLSAFVRVSREHPHYFELSNGRPYIPIGANLCFPSYDKEDISIMTDRWMKKLHENRANYIRVWLSCTAFEIEKHRSGEYDEGRAKNIDKLFSTARQYGIRVKPCIEHFRTVRDEPGLFNRPLHARKNGGPADSMREFFQGEEARNQFKRKLRWYADRYGNDPVVFGWELWNEVNCVGPPELWAPWTEEMLAELHRLFPKNLAMQSLGSFDFDGYIKMYATLCRLPGNDVQQVHRYLDLGARLPICRGPVAELAADAVRTLKNFGVPKPVLLAESGAVEPKHTGPFKYYDDDRDGAIFHDVLFAPFFVGAAGPGQCWHWDKRYIDKHDLWYHIGRFAKAVEGLDPVRERLEPLELPDDRLYLYGLKGKTKTLIWCRDRENSWRAEFSDKKPPETIHGKEITTDSPLNDKTCRVYDPWTDRWTEAKIAGSKVALPDFRRSVVVVVS